MQISVNTNSGAGRDRPGTRGFSLVEVLVVLVIIVIGLFAIIRLMPQGLFTLNQASNVTLAGALTRANEEVLLSRRDNLPEGVVSVDPVTGLISTTISPLDLQQPYPYLDNPIQGYNGPPPEDPRFSNVNKARRVLGEQVKVPPPTLRVGPNGEAMSLYRALFAPIYSDVRMNGSSLGVAAYAGTAMGRIVFRDQDPPDNEDLDRLRAGGPFSYGIDYHRGLVYFLSAGYERRFKIELTYRTDPNTMGQSVPDNCLLIPAAAVPDTGSGAVSYQVWDLSVGQNMAGCVYIPLPPGAAVDPGSDVLFRRLTQLPAGVAFTSDPFQFKVLDNVVGFFGFHPALATMAVPRQRERGLNVRLDYDVDDWHVLRHDTSVSTEVVDPQAALLNRFHVIKLPVAPIKRIGDTEEGINFDYQSAGGGPVNTTYEYQALIRYYPSSSQAPPRAGSVGVDVIIADLETGYLLDSRTLQKPGTAVPLTNSDNSNGHIDYYTGVIHLREQVTMRPPANLGGPALTLPVAGRMLRVYYRTADDHAVATFKPYSSYLRQLQLPNLGDQQYFQYPYGFQLFSNADAEKTVAVDYTWQSRTTGSVRAEIGELHRVESPRSPFAPPSVAGLTPNHWWIRVNQADAVNPGNPQSDNSANPDVVPGSVQVRAIRGVSVQTRVIWRQGKRWKHFQRSTLLTRPQQR